MTVNVLVFPCGTEIALEIHRALSRAKDINLFGATSVSNNHGKFLFKNYIEGIPDVEEPNFILEINKIVREHNIHYIFPAHDSVVLRLSLEAERVECKVICSPKRTCEVCRSKKKTYDYFRGIIPIPRIYQNQEEILEYPVFLKPDIGQGSKGVAYAQLRKDVEYHISKDPSLIVMEYLPGREFTIDCLTDQNGKLIFYGGRERRRILNGISVNTVRVEDERFRLIAEKINEHLVFRGAWFFQVKERKDGELVLMEIAPRIAGTMATYRVLGVNFPLLSLLIHQGVPVEVLKNDYVVEVDRALFNRYSIPIEYEEVYIDFDDTLIKNGKVNTELIAFAFQCINSGVKVKLVTRHKGNILETLRAYRLDGIFDQVYHISDGKSKSEIIQSNKSILIDDSFSERAEVKRNKGIPVFDVDAVESLICWKA
ncbi:MAG: ATP-grasp domain-containing protein [Nitrososphaerota archaeon]